MTGASGAGMGAGATEEPEEDSRSDEALVKEEDGSSEDEST